ncbi:MAG TPA: hypothetical protein VGM98_03595 [Schlesneria sp.]
MKRFAWTLSLLIAGAAIAVAQPPDGPRGGGRGGDFRPPPNPFVTVLDADGDGVISADELKGASESLAKLDTNKDGKLADEEMRPRPPAGERAPGGPGDRGPTAGGDRGRGNDGRNPASGRGGDARGQQGRTGAGRDGGGQGDRGGRGPDGGRGPEGPGGPPGPERFIEHAMQFDADKDGKLGHDELAKFAQDVAQRRGGGPGGPGGPGEGRPNGPGSSGGRSDGGDRPKRPD